MKSSFKIGWLNLTCIILGIATGLARFVLFDKFYNESLKILNSGANIPILILTVFTALLLVFIWFYTHKAGMFMTFHTAKLKNNSRLLYHIAALLFLISGVVLYFTGKEGQWYSLFFSISLVFSAACIYFLTTREGEMRRIMSCAPVLPAVFAILYIYRDNIRYPSVFHFAFELLAMVFIMFALYGTAAAFLKRITPGRLLFFGLTGVFFTFSSLSYYACSLLPFFSYKIRTEIAPPFLLIFALGGVAYFYGAVKMLRRSKVLSSETLRYHGWSAFTVQSLGDVIGIDCYYRQTAGVSYCDFDSFPPLSAFLLSHSHPDHLQDAHSFVKRDACPVIAPATLAKGAKLEFKLTPIDEKTIYNIGGFQIMAFPWVHRELEQVALADDEQLPEISETNPDCLGHIIVTPKNRTIVNLSEAANNKVNFEQIEFILAGIRNVDCLLLGYQLDFIEQCAKCCEILNPKSVLLFHPHEALFNANGTVTAPVQDFIKEIEFLCPHSNVFEVRPGDAFNIQSLLDDEQEIS